LLRAARPLLLLILAAQSGCATALHGPTQQVSVSSEPQEALVTIGSFTGRTPLTVSLPRRNTHWVEIRKDGYRPQSVLVERVMSGAVVGSVLAAGPIGWGVDALTGAQYRLVPERVHVVLAREEPPGGAAPAGGGIPQASLEELRRAGAITPAEYEAITRRLAGPPVPPGRAIEPATRDPHAAAPSAPGASPPALSGAVGSRPPAAGPHASGPAVLDGAPAGPPVSDSAAPGHNVGAATGTAVAVTRLPAPGLPSTWLLGLWATQGPEQRADQEPLRFEFRKEPAAVTWRSTGHHPVEPGSAADATGNVVELTELWIELVGMDGMGRPVKYYLTRTGDMLRGYGFLAGSASPVATALTRVR
jgi:hypothetical protein